MTTELEYIDTQTPTSPFVEGQNYFIECRGGGTYIGYASKVTDRFVVIGQKETIIYFDQIRSARVV